MANFMKRTGWIAACALLLAGTQAGAREAHGTVRAVDPTRGTVTINEYRFATDGAIWVRDENGTAASLRAVKEGMQVFYVTDDKDGALTRIQILPDDPEKLRALGFGALVNH